MTITAPRTVRVVHSPTLLRPSRPSHDLRHADVVHHQDQYPHPMADDGGSAVLDLAPGDDGMGLNSRPRPEATLLTTTEFSIGSHSGSQCHRDSSAEGNAPGCNESGGKHLYAVMYAVAQQVVVDPPRHSPLVGLRGRIGTVTSIYPPAACGNSGESPIVTSRYCPQCARPVHCACPQRGPNPPSRLFGWIKSWG